MCGYLDSKYCTNFSLFTVYDDSGSISPCIYCARKMSAKSAFSSLFNFDMNAFLSQDGSARYCFNSENEMSPIIVSSLYFSSKVYSTTNSSSSFSSFFSFTSFTSLSTSSRRRCSCFLPGFEA